MAKIKVTQVELDGGIAYTTDEEILRVADEIRRKKETPKFREGQIIYVSDTGNDWYLRRYLRYENGKHIVWTDDAAGGCAQEWTYARELSWIDKARIIAPPKAKWAAVEESGRCFFFVDKPVVNILGWKGSQSRFQEEFRAFNGPCEDWKELVVEL